MRIHLTGIKGVGMTGLAQILQAQNHILSGSDVAEDFVTRDTLRKLNIPTVKYSSENITPKIEKVIYSPAYSSDHPELQKAAELKIKIQSYIEAVAELFNQKQGLAITGTHGKTTTSALLGHVLQAAGQDPTVLIGAPVINFDRMNARVGNDNFFVLEACEFRNHFHHYQPYAAIITNIDFDHADFFPTREDYENSFQQFGENIDPNGFLAIREADAKKVNFFGKTITFGLKSKTADWTARDIKIKDQTISFTVIQNQTAKNLTPQFSRKRDQKYSLRIPGQHNIENALAVIALCHELKIDFEKIEEGLATFQGTARRQEVRGELDGVLVIDDYGHHPAEIQATIKALREFYPQRRMIVAFQSHTHTRTRALLNEFAKSFTKVDLLFIPEIFPSARELEMKNKISATELATAIQKQNPDLKIIAGDNMLTPNEIQNFAQKVQQYTQPGDLLLTIGAGETDKLAEAYFSSAT